MKLSDLAPALAALERDRQLRKPDDARRRAELECTFGSDFVDAASNDYLGFARHVESQPQDVSRETSAPLHPGAGASRLVFGTADEHLAVERQVAAWVGLPAALLFSSGYAANLGALSALLSPEDAVFSDSLNHASLIDGMRLARVRPSIFPHLDLAALEEELQAAAGAPARWVIVEAYYSMDGDGPDLGRLRALCDRYDAGLYVDEAHSVGTFGPAGAGLCLKAGVRPDVLMVAFGKAVGGYGACVAGSVELRTWLWNRARSFVFSTAPSPAATDILHRQIARARAAHSARNRLEEVCKRVRCQLEANGVCPPNGSFGPVLSLVLGSEEAALDASAALQSKGILAQAIRPPTVPQGRSRLRLILRATHTDGDLSLLVDALAKIVPRETPSEETS